MLPESVHVFLPADCLPDSWNQFRYVSSKQLLGIVACHFTAFVVNEDEFTGHDVGDVNSVAASVQESKKVRLSEALAGGCQKMLPPGGAQVHRKLIKVYDSWEDWKFIDW